ncbi:hypothetical protein FVE85_0444 [Porphyridium purpureum]|uniref:Rubisco accumulation factor 1 C-terminal domain-containing protein n=1 Tax=Porphyridium purpureum TaxID=35688 RepID=A0A5J4YZX9_PORPP|nr:hypothetical protein FVE85_0444 [Porphyridium purpureum]|eukprot:POR9814..scf208_2
MVMAMMTMGAFVGLGNVCYGSSSHGVFARRSNVCGGVGAKVVGGRKRLSATAISMVQGGEPPAPRGDSFDKMSDEEMQRVIQALIKKKEEEDARKRKEKLAAAEQAGVDLLTPLKHGEKGRFAPLTRIDDPDFMPRMAPVLGWIQDLSPEDVIAAPKLNRVDVGSVWNGVEISGNKFQLMTLPAEDQAITAVLNPVVILAKNTELNIPINPACEVVVVVERARTEFAPGVFFVWDVRGTVQFGYFDEMPAEAKCLGEVIRVLFHIKNNKKATSSGFAEFSDDFEF